MELLARSQPVIEELREHPVPDGDLESPRRKLRSVTDKTAPAKVNLVRLAGLDSARLSPSPLRAGSFEQGDSLCWPIATILPVDDRGESRIARLAAGTYNIKVTSYEYPINRGCIDPFQRSVRSGISRRLQRENH